MITISRMTVVALLLGVAGVALVAYRIGPLHGNATHRLAAARHRAP